MGKTFTYLMGLVLFMSLSSCATFPLLAPPPSATPSGPRTIVLDGEAVTEEDVGGFILSDGGYSGAHTYYRRTGLEHRWDWCPNETNYVFVIKPDGTGLYYDFSSVPYGESTKASDVFQCYRR